MASTSDARAAGSPQDELKSGHVSNAPYDTSSELFRVSVRIPPFWPSDPEIWFAQIEAQFANANITTDLTKYNYVVSNLDSQYATEVRDIIISPPHNGRYEKIKSELIKRLTASQEKKVKQLLLHEELGDRKPSQFLRHLKSLAGDKTPEDFLKTIWISRLPSSIQTVLAGNPTSTSLDVLADLADRIQEIAPPQVASTSASTPDPLQAMAREIAELRKEMQALRSQPARAYRRSPSSSRSQRNRSSSASRSHSSYRKFPNCWYHNKFGSKAVKCVAPCDFKSENTRGSQ